MPKAILRFLVLSELWAYKGRTQNKAKKSKIKNLKPVKDKKQKKQRKRMLTNQFFWKKEKKISWKFEIKENLKIFKNYREKGLKRNEKLGKILKWRKKRNIFEKEYFLKEKKNLERKYFVVFLLKLRKKKKRFPWKNQYPSKVYFGFK